MENDIDKMEKHIASLIADIKFLLGKSDLSKMKIREKQDLEKTLQSLYMTLYDYY